MNGCVFPPAFMHARSAALLLTLLVAACSSSAPADDAVPAGGEEVRVTGDDGSVQAGGDVPDDWPSDVPVMEGTAVLFAGSQESGEGAGMGLMLSTAAPAKDIIDFYKKALAAKGWAVQNVMISSIASGMEAEKDGRHLVVGVTGDGEQTTITIGIETR